MGSQRPCKFVRGFSMVDPEMVSKLHTDIKARGKEKHEIARFNFTLPDFSQLDQEFVAYIMKDLIENSTLRALEESGHLNWWTKGSNLQRLFPLLTSGDGNCLLHAASLGIWGVHDRWLNLRQDVHHMLSSKVDEGTLKRRWLWYEWIKNLQEGLEFNADEWEAEWISVLSMADAKPKSPQTKLSTVPEGSTVENEEASNTPARIVSNSWQPRYESLAEIHICSLAHVLRRPIIIISDNWVYDFEGKPLSPIPFAGVYLPVECDPSDCCRIPLVLAYSSSHFSPVVSTELQSQTVESSGNVASTPNKGKTNSTSGNKSANPSDQTSKSPSDQTSKSPSDQTSKSPSDKTLKSPSDQTSKSPSNPTTTRNATSALQTVVSSVYEVTKSTILQAAKSLSPTSMVASSPPKQPIHAAVPLVDKDLKILALPFATDPGPNWNWLKNENSEDTIKKNSLTDEQRMLLLKKYLDVIEVDMKLESLPGERMEVSGQNAGKTSSGTENDKENTNNEIPKLCKVPVAILPCDNQPSFYKEVIDGYLKKAKETFDFEKETKIIEPNHTPSVKCANDGCDLYGTVEHNYLCTKCFQLQTKSVAKFQGPPPYDPPSYMEVTSKDQVFHPPSFAGKSNKSQNTTTLKEISTLCRAPGCTFFGTPGKDGFCSKCYNERVKSIK